MFIPLPVRSTLPLPMAAGKGEGEKGEIQGGFMGWYRSDWVVRLIKSAMAGRKTLDRPKLNE